MSKALDQFKEIFKESELSVPSVVKQCKVADMQIYRLLDDKVLNPRIGTLNEIGKVLGFEVMLSKICKSCGGTGQSFPTLEYPDGTECEKCKPFIKKTK